MTDGAAPLGYAIFNIYTAIAAGNETGKRDATRGYIALIREHYRATRAAYVVQYVLGRGEFHRYSRSDPINPYP